MSLTLTLPLIVTFLMLTATAWFGLYGFLFPHKTMQLLHLRIVGRTDGISEIRGASGALWLGISVAAMFYGGVAVMMVGIAYAGAATGRLAAILLDGAGSQTTVLFLAVEALFAAWLIWYGVNGGAGLFTSA